MTLKPTPSEATAPPLGKRLKRAFFARSVHEVAPDLIGVTLLVDPTADEMTQRGIEAVISVPQATMSLAAAGGEFTCDPYGIAQIDRC